MRELKFSDINVQGFMANERWTWISLLSAYASLCVLCSTCCIRPLAWGLKQAMIPKAAGAISSLREGCPVENSGNQWGPVTASGGETGTAVTPHA